MIPWKQDLTSPIPDMVADSGLQNYHNIAYLESEDDVWILGARKKDERSSLEYGIFLLKLGCCIAQKKPLSNAFDRGFDHPILTFIQTIVEITAFE